MAADGTLDADVGRLLTASRDAHARKKHAAGLVDQQGQITSAPNYSQAEQHIADAIRLRLEAHALDPEHQSPAWAIDEAANRQTDEEMLKFFVAYAKPLISPVQMAQLVARDPSFAEIQYIP